MHGHQHKKMGVAAGVGILAYAVLSKNLPMESAVATLICPVGALLSDIDSDRSKLGRVRNTITTLTSFLITVGVIAAIAGVSYFSYMSGGIWKALLSLLFFAIPAFLIYVVQKNKGVKKVLGFITMHRGIMHSLVPIALMIASTVWITDSIYKWCAYSMSIGYFVHLLGDMATIEGVPLLWPLCKFNIRYSWFTTSKHESAINFVCNVWCIVFVGIGMYFGIKGGF